MNSFSHSIFKPIIQACRQLRIQPLNHSLLLSSPKVMHSSLHLFSRSLTHSVIQLSQQPFLSALHALSSFRQFAVSAFSQLSPIWLWVKSLHEYRQLSILKMNTGLGSRWWFGPVPRVKREPVPLVVVWFLPCRISCRMVDLLQFRHLKGRHGVWQTVRHVHWSHVKEKWWCESGQILNGLV